MSDYLVDFIRAQLDEDERIANSLPKYEGTTDDLRLYTAKNYPCEQVLEIGKLRLLDEVEAKRRVVDLCQLVGPDRLFIGSAFPPGDEREFAAQVLALLALPYADRPGYRDEWRP